MNGAAGPAGSLLFAVALALSFADRRTIGSGLVIAMAGVILGALTGGQAGWASLVIAASWIGVILTALAVHLPRGVGTRLAWLLSTNAGLWCGLLAAQNGWPVLAMLPLPLLALLGRWVVARGYGIALKVVASWLVAVAGLALALPLFTTPGNVPDHMD